MSTDERTAILEQRRDQIREWLDEAAPYTSSDQKHLDTESQEQAYWHHGYQAALDDIIKLLNP